MTMAPCQIVAPYRGLAADYDDALGRQFFLRARDAFEHLQRHYGFGFRSAADIGCGTGIFARYLARKWRVPVFAVDRSAAMLAQARRTCRGEPVQVIQQDLRNLQLPTPVDLITANYDVLNHLVAPSDIKQALQRVHANLNLGGHFYFDLITPCLGLPPAKWTRFIRRTRRGAVSQFLLWTPREALLRINVMSQRTDPPRADFERHVERAYTPQQIARWLCKAGFQLRAVHDEATGHFAVRCAPRLLFLATRA
jgi:SAM-dependent methyltransferase